SKDGNTWTTDLSSLTATAVADSCTIKVRASNPNYKNIAESSATLTIEKREVTLTSADGEKEYDGNALTKNAQTDVTVSGDGFVAGEGATYDITGTQTLVGSSKNTFTYELNEGTSADNYEITKEEGTLTVKDRTKKYEIEVEANSNSGKYDGTEKTAEGFKTLTFEVDGHTYTVEGLSAAVTKTDAGNYDNKISGTAVVKDADGNDVTAQFTVRQKDGKLEISKRSVTLTSETDSKVYDGKPLTNSNVTVSGEGFVEGEGATYDVTGTITDPGNTKNTFTYTLNEGTKAGNYEITQAEGTLTVKKSENEIVITADSDSKTYDGTPLTKSTYTYTEGVLAEGDVLTAVVEGTITDVGTAANVVKSYKVMRGATDVTANYTFGESVDGELEVTKRTVTLTSADDEKVFDGKALTNNEVTEGGDGFVKGEGATYEVTGTQTEVGSSKNTFTYKLNDGTKADNYEITTVEGTLKVTPVTETITVTITGHSDTAKYDGTEKTVSGYDVSISNPLYAEADFEFNGDAIVKGTDADTYEMGLKPEDFTNNSANFTNVVFVIIDGSLEISKREVTLTSEGGEKPYDGTALTKPEVKVSGDGFVGGEVTDIKATGSVTTVDEGEVTNTITYTEGAKFKADNYTITKNEGKLKITASEGKLVITSSTKSWKYDGELHTDDVYTVVYDGKAAERVVNRRMRLMAKARPTPEPQVFLLSTGDTVTITSTAEGVVDYSDSYNENNTYDYVITNAENYSDVTANVGTLSIDKREVTLTSESASKVYDGTALTNDKVTVGGDGFAQGEEVTFTVTGSQTLVGESKNTFTYTLGEGMKADNYNIKVTEGTLTVTDGTTPPDEPVPDDLVVTKTVEDKTYALDEEVTFTITVTNIYEEAKTIVLTEIDGVMLEQSRFEDVEGGETITTTATYKIKEEDILKGSFENIVTAEVGNLKKEAKAVVETEEANPHLKVDKVTTSTPEDGKVYKLGEKITYEITVTNDGNLTITDIEVKDELTGENWSIETLAPEESRTFKTEHVVTEQDIIKGSVLNTATAKGKGPDDEHDPDPDPGTSEDPTDPKRSHLTVVKETTSEPKNGKAYDLGEKITYRITVTNDGNVTISDITVTDELTGDKWTIESLVPGASEEFEASYTVTAADQKACSVVNEATATGKDPEGKEPDVVPGVDEEPTTEPGSDVPQTGTAKETVILTSMSAGSMLLAIWLMLIRKKRKEEE
ncbi:MAG: LPXTG cell wall anchor domain-containing protein, partial [Oscillospiraceae bacterium]|nr:LPXTG cell wall anchor domain-containing protein [Oscillospiraceae bacterium]